MRIDPAGWPFILGGLAVALLSWLTGGPIFGLIFGVLTLFFVFFFRDPERQHNAPDSAVVSPADGRVMVAGDPTGTPPPGTWRQITIFLSPMDVHVNRMPVSGRVAAVKYHPGRFLPAYRADAGRGDDRSWWATDRRPADRRHSRSPHRVPRARRGDGEGRRAIRGDEVRVAYGRVCAARLHDSHARRC
jgi:phosphatidylserine decarboxylase